LARGVRVRITQLLYSVESRTAAQAGIWTRLADVIASSTNRVVEVLDVGAAGNPAGFYRLVTPRNP